ncbi:MAG: GNAT family N-acetyltransferase [Bacteroidales bacterium]
MREMEQNIVHSGNEFFLDIGGERSLLSYELFGDNTVVFTHTFVPENLRGQGIASRLIRRGVEWAHDKGYNIVAECWAVERFLERHPEYRQPVHR